MKKLFFLHALFSLLFLSQVVIAQKTTIKGVLIDSTAKPLPLATVMLLQAKDSALATFGRTNEQGEFELKNISPDNYLLKITYIGFKTYNKQISAQQAGELNLGKIQMEFLTKELNGVTIEAEKAAVTFKRDTIEFNAGSFKTKENAVVEDLLKKLPGVEVQRDGTIKSQGETVQRVTVNGKDFFGRDPKIATKNLPAEAVEKVQVYDRKSDQAVFSGIEDGQKEKTINLELKEKYKNAGFGNVMVGVGNDKRYENRLSYNRFNKTSQLSILGMGNNVNQQGFSMDDYMNFSGNSRSMMNGGSVRIEINSDNQGGIPLNFGGRNYGFMNNWAGGANFAKTLSPKTEITGNYFYNWLNQKIDQDVDRKNFLPNGTFSSVQNTSQNNTNNNHRFNLIAEHKIDSANSLKLTSAFTYNQTEAFTNSTNKTFDDKGITQNEGERKNLRNGSSLDFNNDLLYRHRFAKKGRTLSSNFTFRANEQDSKSNLEAVNKYYGLGNRTDNINQKSTQSNYLYTVGANISYTEPIAKKKYLEFNYNFRNTANKVNQEVYDIKDSEQTLNQNLTNKYDNNFAYHRIGVNYRMNMKKANFSTGLSLQNSNIEGKLLLRDTQISRSFSNLLPNLHFNYDFTNSKRFNIDYETSVQEPNVNQLQPVIDNRDPLNIYVGNPNLRPAYAHNVRANFLTFDPISNINFFGFVNAIYTTNYITTAQSIDRQFVRTTTPTNVKDNLMLTSNLSFGFPIKKLNSRFNISTNNTLMQGINVLNNLENKFQQQTISGRLRYDFGWKDWINIGLSTDISKQETKYEFNERQNQVFVNQTYTADGNFTFPKGFSFSTDLDYLIYKSQTTDFKQEIPILNMSVAKTFLKANAGELKFSVNNLLDQNIGASQQAQVNYLEQTIIRSLGRYFMLSFTYSLNKAMNPSAGRRGGMMRIIR